MNKEQRLEIFKALGEGKTVRLQMETARGLEWFEYNSETFTTDSLSYVRDFEVKREPAIYCGTARAVPRLPGHDPSVGLHVSPLHRGLMFHVVATEMVDGAPSCSPISTVSLDNDRPRYVKCGVQAVRWGNVGRITIEVDERCVGEAFDVIAMKAPLEQQEPSIPGTPKGQKVSIFARPAKE